MVTAIVDWTKQTSIFNSSQYDVYPRIAFGGDGHVYVVYYGAKDTNISGGSSAGEEDIVVFSLDGSDGSVRWARQTPVFNSPQNVMDPEIEPQIAIGIDGHVYVTYNGARDTQISGGSSGGDDDIIVFSLNSLDGSVRWTKQTPVFNSLSRGRTPQIAIGKDGYVYIVYGATGGQPISGGSNAEGSSALNGDIVVFSLDNSNGSVIWVRQTPVFNSAKLDQFPQIAIGEDGHIYICYNGGLEPQISGGSAAGAEDVIVFSLDSSNGFVRWIRQTPVFNSSGTDGPPQIAMGTDGHVYITYGGAAYTPISGGSNAGNQDIVVFSLNSSDGSVRWVTQSPVFNSSQFDGYPEIAIGTDGHVYITYNIAEDTQISGGSSAGSRDIVVFSLNSSNGSVRWVKQYPIFNSSQYDYFPKIAIGTDGYIYVTYYGTENTQISGGSGTGSFDVVVFSLDPFDGSVRWTKQTPVFNSSGADAEPRIVTGQAGQIYISYYGAQDTQISGGSSAGSFDVVVFKIRELGSKQPVLCVDEGTVIDGLGIQIQHVQSYTEDFKKLLYTGMTQDFVRLGKGSLSKGIPNKDLYLTPGHKIFYKGKKVAVGKLTFKPGIRLYRSPEPRRTYNLCFQEEKTVKMHGVDVCQWGEKKFMELLRKKNWKYDDKDGITKIIKGDLMEPVKNHVA